jgi:hypothetical protein
MEHSDPSVGAGEKEKGAIPSGDRAFLTEKVE